MAFPKKSARIAEAADVSGAHAESQRTILTRKCSLATEPVSSRSAAASVASRRVGRVVDTGDVTVTAMGLGACIGNAEEERERGEKKSRQHTVSRKLQREQRVNRAASLEMEGLEGARWRIDSATLRLVVASSGTAERATSGSRKTELPLRREDSAWTCHINAQVLWVDKRAAGWGRAGERRGESGEKEDRTVEREEKEEGCKAADTLVRNLRHCFVAGTIRSGS